MSKRTNLIDNLVTPSLGKEETFQSRSMNRFLNTLHRQRQRTECTKVKARAATDPEGAFELYNPQIDRLKSRHLEDIGQRNS